MILFLCGSVCTCTFTCHTHVYISDSTELQTKNVTLFFEKRFMKTICAVEICVLDTVMDSDCFATSWNFGGFSFKILLFRGSVTDIHLRGRRKSLINTLILQMRSQMTGPVSAVYSCCSSFWLFIDQLKWVASSHRWKRHRSILTLSLFLCFLFLLIHVYLLKKLPCVIRLNQRTTQFTYTCPPPPPPLNTWNFKVAGLRAIFIVSPPVLCVSRCLWERDTLGYKGSCFWCSAVCIFLK